MVDSNLEFARGGAQFTVELLKKLAANGFNRSILYSPFSIQSSVALAFAGACGETADEIARAMNLNSTRPSQVGAAFQNVLEKYKDSDLLKIASKVYVKKGYNLKEKYVTSTKENYNVEAEELNFAECVAAAEAVNFWVETKTAGKIKNLVVPDSFDERTRLVLLSALHFKGDWNQKFDESRTVEGDFWLTEKQSVKVNYMNQKAKFGYGYFEELNCQALDMPYKNSDLSMFVLLPNEREGLKDLAEKLKGNNLVDLAERLSTEEVLVKFPKFKMDYSAELCHVLTEMGMNKAFGKDADFGNILESDENLYISSVMHKACIEVNEEGCEAAAATATIMMCRMMLRPLEFEADHPFLYVIWNKRNIFLAGTLVASSL